MMNTNKKNDGKLIYIYYLPTACTAIRAFMFLLSKASLKKLTKRSIGIKPYEPARECVNKTREPRVESSC